MIQAVLLVVVGKRSSVSSCQACLEAGTTVAYKGLAGCHKPARGWLRRQLAHPKLHLLEDSRGSDVAFAAVVTQELVLLQGSKSQSLEASCLLMHSFAAAFLGSRSRFALSSRYGTHCLALVLSFALA